MTTRVTVQRLGLLIADGDTDAVRSAVADNPRLLTATVERDGQDGWTPLHLAVASGRADVVRALGQSGADLSARTEGHRTPLHVALEHAPDLVPVLVRLGADVDAMPHDGASALDISLVAAARARRADEGRATGDDALAELLVAHGATH